MAYHFSANQYEDAFSSKKLRNWTVPRKYKERPSTLEGYTQFIANNRGHLLENVPRSKVSPWGTFMGTWDMPRNIPPVRPSYTARSQQAADRLRYLRHTSSLNEAVNGYKPFCFDKPEKYKKLKAPTPPPAITQCEIPQPSGQPRAASVRSRKSASPAELKETGSVHSRGDSAASQRGTPASRHGTPTSHRGTPVQASRRSSRQASRAASNTSHPLMFDNNIPVSPTPSLRSGGLPAMPDSGRTKSGRSVEAEVCPA